MRQHRSLAEQVAVKQVRRPGKDPPQLDLDGFSTAKASRCCVVSWSAQTTTSADVMTRQREGGPFRKGGKRNETAGASTRCQFEIPLAVSARQLGAQGKAKQGKAPDSSTMGTTGATLQIWTQRPLSKTNKQKSKKQNGAESAVSTVHLLCAKHASETCETLYQIITMGTRIWNSLQTTAFSSSRRYGQTRVLLRKNGEHFHEKTPRFSNKQT